MCVCVNSELFLRDFLSNHEPTNGDFIGLNVLSVFFICYTFFMDDAKMCSHCRTKNLDGSTLPKLKNNNKKRQRKLGF